MKTRRYKSKDLNEIVELFNNAVHYINVQDYNKLQLDAWASNDIDIFQWDKTLSKNYSIVAEKNNIIVGFGDIESNGYLNRLYVHKDYQHLGIGSKILNELEKYPSINSITTLTTHSSITAKEFFRHKGYIEISEQNVERKGQLLKNFIMEKNFN